VKPARWLLPGLLVALGLVSTVVGQSRLGAAEFAERLSLAADLAQQGTAEPSTSRMSELRETLALPVEVDVGGWLLSVPADPYLESLSGESGADFERAGAHVRALQDALDEAVAREVPAAADVDQALDRAYSGLVQDQPSLPELLLRAIGELVGAVLYRLANFVGPTSILAWAVLVGLAVAAIFLLRRARLVPDWSGPASTAPSAAADRIDWSARAEAAIRAGDLREAVRALYLVLLASLARGGLLAEAPALTAGEARSAIRRAAPALYPSVARATDSYERVVYGGAEPDEADLQLLREAATQATRR
jgi:Domain of unknown function (DUF4129)